MTGLGFTPYVMHGRFKLRDPQCCYLGDVHENPMKTDSSDNEEMSTWHFQEQEADYRANLNEAKRRIVFLEGKMKEMVELLHMWKNEAHDYRLLAESMIEGSTSIKEAREVCRASYRKGDKKG